MNSSLLLSWYGERLIEDNEHQTGHESNENASNKSESTGFQEENQKFQSNNANFQLDMNAKQKPQTIKLEAKQSMVVENQNQNENRGISPISENNNNNNSQDSDQQQQQGMLGWIPKKIMNSTSWFSNYYYSQNNGQNNQQQTNINDSSLSQSQILQNPLSQSQQNEQQQQQQSRWTQWTNYISSLKNVSVKLPELKPSKCAECAWTSAAIEFPLGYRNCASCRRNFCSTHCGFKISLARNSSPVLVCHQCFMKTREQKEGVVNNLTEQFQKYRSMKTERKKLAFTQMKRNLDKLDDEFRKTQSQNANISNQTVTSTAFSFATSMAQNLYDKAYSETTTTSACLSCGVALTFWSKKVQCQLCLNIYCPNCSKLTMPSGNLRENQSTSDIPNFTINVCQTCHGNALVLMKKTKFQKAIQSSKLLIEHYIQVCRVLSMLGTTFYDSGARSIFDPKQQELLQDFELMETNENDENDQIQKSEQEQRFEEQVSNLQISRFANDQSIVIEKDSDENSNNSNNSNNNVNSQQKNTCDLTMDVSAFKPEVASKIMQLFQQYMQICEKFLQSYSNYSSVPSMASLSNYGKQKNQFIYKNIEQFLLSSDLVLDLRKFFEIYHQHQLQEEEKAKKEKQQQLYQSQQLSRSQQL